MLAAEDVLALHRLAVGTPSVSGEEAALADQLAAWLEKHGATVERVGGSLLALTGSGPLLLLDTHLDTVPPASGWRADPFTPRIEDGRVIGLGANDAKAAVAAMCAAFVSCLGKPLPFTLGLALVEGEETKNLGTARVLEHLAARGRTVAAAVIGEPTGLDIAVAQKGLLVLELAARGTACHAAHAAALGADNAIRGLARDLVAIEDLAWGAPHPLLGPITLEPTVLAAGKARNAVPAEATAILDVRTTPALATEEICERIRARIEGELNVISARLKPRDIPADAPLVRAARRAWPQAKLYGSATLSDWALFEGVPAFKCGPGESERSHTAEEFVLEEEVLAGADFYLRLIGALAATGLGEAA